MISSQVLSPTANAGAVVLITGGGTGIGRATALEFARTGARVAICGRRVEPLQATIRELAALGAEHSFHCVDIREPEQIPPLVGAVREKLGEITVLVNNAGGQFTAPAEQITRNGWRAVHRLAVESAWDLTRTVAISSMIPARAGVILFLGFSPRRGLPGFVHASAARASLENLASGLALEWSKYSIRTLCVALGTIHTEGLDSYGSGEVAKWTQEIPLGRLGDPSDAASVITFLASPGAAFITGTTVTVDGGTDAWGLAEPPPLPMSSD
jgi:NAD(P)-dependent dehydrogenase (short-subunit alcohol dehydrogenase family)